MLTLFKILFRKTAHQLTEQSYKQGITIGFKMGREYTENHVRLFGANVEKEVNEILKAKGF